MPDLKLSWERCDGEWCRLLVCDPPADAAGVYVIWEPLMFVRGRRAVCVGQGVIGARLAHHRGDESVGYHGKGTLLVTWAACPADAMDGVVSFLADAYRPCEGRPAPRVEPVSVNMPL